MGTNDSSNPAQCPLELVEILKRLGANSRELHAQVFGKPLWTREQSDGYWRHPLVWACKWLEERVGGISRHELEHAAFRLTTPLGLKGMDPLPGPDEDFLTALEGNAKRELCELYDLMAADKTPPELKGQGKPVQLTEKQQAALAGLRPKCFQVISEEQAEALAQLPGRAVQRRRPSEGDPGMPDWLLMTGKFRELDRDGTTDRDSTTTRLWRQLSEEYPTILVEAGIPVASQPRCAPKPPRSIDADEAEAVARRLDKKELTFCHGKAQEMAARIRQESGKPCSASLVKGLPFWNEAMERTGRGRKKGGAKGKGRKRGTAARPVNLSKEVEAVTGEGRDREVLEALAEAEDQTNAERAMQEQMQSVALVKRSRLSDEEKQQTIAKLEAGEMTPQQANQMVSMCQQDSTRNRKKSRSHD